MKTWDNLQVGTHIRHENTRARAVVLEVGASGKTFLLSEFGNKNKVYNWFTVEEAKYYNPWDIVQDEEAEDWLKEGVRYWTVDFTAEDSVDEYTWGGAFSCDELYDKGLCFRTEGEAREVAEKMLNTLKS